MVNYKSLVGRQWEYGIFDFYTIVPDYYELLGINLPDYERPKDVKTCESIFLKDLDNFILNKKNLSDKLIDDFNKKYINNLELIFDEKAF